MIRQWINNIMKKAANKQNEEIVEPIRYTPMPPEIVLEMQESLLGEAGVNSHNFGQKALEALYDNNEDSRDLLEAILEKYVLPLQQEK